MNYHIMVYEKKFIDEFILDLIKTKKIKDHKLYIRPTLNDTFQYATYLNNLETEKDIIFLLKGIRPNDSLIIHWYDSYIGGLILKFLNKNTSLNVVHWGGDFFQDPEVYFEKKNIDVLTRKVSKEKFKVKTTIFKELIKPLRILKKKIITLHLFKVKKATVKRIDNLLLHPANKFDYLLTEKIFDVRFKKHIPFFYNLNFDISQNVIKHEKTKNTSPLRVLLGNSSNESNNHIDAFYYLLKSYKPQEVEIILPLAYGNPEMVPILIEIGNNLFGDNLVPIVEMLDKEKYIELLNNIDVALFFHNRSQAFGNIITLLTLGKLIFMKSENTLFQLISSLNIYGVFPYQDLYKSKTLLEEFTEEKRINNLKILNKNFSDEFRLECIKNLNFN